MDKKPNKEDNWLEITHKECRNIRELVDEINSIASAFYNTGNTLTSDKLFDIAFELGQSERNIHRTIGKKVNDDWKQSQESSAAMFKAVIAGIQLQKGKG